MDLHHYDRRTPPRSTARRSGPLAGRARVPGDKSISHRALILGALAVGETRITGLLEGEDVLNTAQTLRALGAACRAHRRAALARSRRRRRRLRRAGRGARFRQFRHRLPAHAGAVAGCPITATFDGDASLRTRPMRRMLDPLERIGARTLASTDGGGCR